MHRLYFLIILFSGLSFAQNQKSVPVFPGCENYTQNSDLSKCMNQELNKALSYELAYFSIVADYLEIPESAVKVGFNINRDGLFTDVNVEGTNEIFNGFVMSTFYLMNSKIDRAEKKIIPGKDENGNPIDTNFKIPLRFLLENPNALPQQINPQNRVLFTFYNERDQENIEIRIDSTFTLSTYAVRPDREFFLGNFKSLIELAMIDPYAENIQKNFHSGNTFVTKGMLNEKEYTIQLKNFFNNDPNSEVYLEVFNEVDNEWKEYYRYNSKAEFNASPFVILTHRK